MLTICMLSKIGLWCKGGNDQYVICLPSDSLKQIYVRPDSFKREDTYLYVFSYKLTTVYGIADIS